MDELRQVELLIATESVEVELVCAPLRAAGARILHVATTVDEGLAICGERKPDIAIFGMSIGGRPSLGLMRSIRRGENGANRFLPIAIAAQAPDARLVQLALTAGAHEFIALPTAAKVIAALVQRAVLVGRPFVDEASYAGPCRRRRAADVPEERRARPWAGYVHAAHAARPDLDETG